MSQLHSSIRILFSVALITAFGTNLFAQGIKKQIKPNIVFQYSSWGMVRLEIRDSIEGQDQLTCSYVEQGDQPNPVALNDAEVKHLKSLLQSLKKESYSLSLPAHGVVVISDGESVEIELDAVSLRLLYRDNYESAKSHKPIRFLVDWIKRKFPTISTPK